MKHDEIPFMRLLMLALGRVRGLRIWRQNVGNIPIRDRTGKVQRIFSAGPPNGAADITGIMAGGVRLEIEVKAAKGKASPEQQAWRRMIEAHGGVYIVAQYDEATSDDENVARVVAEVLAAAARVAA